MARKLISVSLALAAPFASAGFFDDLADKVNNEAEKQKSNFNSVINDAKKSTGMCAFFGCGTPYTSTNSCQCNSDCATYGSCCPDYDALCKNDLANKVSAKLGEAQAAMNDATAKGNELAQKMQDAKDSALQHAQDQVNAHKATAEQLAQDASDKANAVSDSLKQQLEAKKNAVEELKAKAAEQSQAASGAVASVANAAQQAQAQATEASIDQAKAKVKGFAAGAQSEAKKDMDNLAAALRAKSGSCLAYGCKTEFTLEHSCHCTQECVAKGDCCSDYQAVCANGLGDIMGKAKEQAAELKKEADTHLGSVAALKKDAQDALTNAGEKAKEKAAALEIQAKDQAQSAVDAATGALGKADELKQCGAKAVDSLKAAKLCMEADATQVCNCVADFNSSTQACSAHVNGMKSLDALPGAASCKQQVLKTLKGKFKLSISNAEAFLGKDSAVAAVEKAVAKMADVPAKYVSVFMKPLKDMGLGRRLEDASEDVEADYEITVPDSSPTFSKLNTETLKNLQESVATAKETLQQEISSTVGDGFTLSAVAEEVPPAEKRTAGEQPKRLPWQAYAGAGLLAAALIGGIVYMTMGLCSAKKGAKKKKTRAVKSAPVADEAPAPKAALLAPAATVPAHYAPVAQYTVAQAPMLHAAAPVATQAYHMPVYYPATTVTSSPGSFVAAAPAAYVPTAQYP